MRTTGSMIRLRPGRVLEVVSSRPGATIVRVDVDGEPAMAVAYDALSGPLRAGQRVLLNTTAVWLGLGSGGYHFVICSEGNSVSETPAAARVMKLRYTPMQVAVCVPEESRAGETQADELAQFTSLDGTPVVVCELHSMVAPALAGAKAFADKQPRTAYIMTDGGALPAWFSQTVGRIRETGLADMVITSGHAFGGDSEAVNVYSALAQARILARADVVVVGMGPGIVGTGTRLGFTGLECADVANAVQALNGRPFVVPRLSSADPRLRHRGVSHHTHTVLQVTLATTTVAAHSEAPATILQDLVRAAGSRHTLELGDGRPGLELLEALGIRPETMGRGQAEEADFFLAASAAGWLAARAAFQHASTRQAGR